MRLSLVEAVFYALAVGIGEVYFVADAVRLGASRLEQGLVVTLPLCVGSLGPFVSLAALRRVAGRRRVVVAAVFLQSSVLLGMALSSYLRLESAGLLILMASAYQLCGQASGTAWSSWYGDLVPARVRGRYFAMRTRTVHLVTSVALLFSGVALEKLEPGAAGSVVPGSGGLGFAWIFAVAGACRAISGTLLALSPEPPFQGLPGLQSTRTFFTTQRGSSVRRLLGVACALQLAVYVASPYFGPYMLTELKLGYVEYMAASLAAVAAKFLLLPAWGRSIDHLGARPVYLLALVLVAIVPVPWLWAHGVVWVVAAQCLSGFAWGGHEVSHFSLLLEATEPHRRPHVFAVMNAVNGLAQLAGGLLGAELLGLGPEGFLVVFAVSTVGRLAAAAVAPRAIVESVAGKSPRRRQVLFRLLGFTPSGGVMHRPMFTDAGTPEGSEERDGPTS